MEYWDAINLCFERQETLELQGHIMGAHTWGNLQGHHQNHDSCCETMYPQLDLRTLVIISCPKCFLFTKCGYVE
jgi:hypothetical protein